MLAAMRCLTGCSILACFVLSLSGCDKRTAQEKGKDFASEKVEYAQGAAGVLEQKGKGLGKSIGKGIGDLAKGTGTAIKDVINPEVKVVLAPESADTGVKVLQAHEGDSSNQKRNVVVYAEFPKKYQGRLQLRAFADADKEIARSEITANLDRDAGTNQNLTFGFPPDMRLSKVDHYLLVSLPPKMASVSADLAAAGLKVSQLKEQDAQVSVYVVFSKAYRGGLELRAVGPDGNEIGRSEPTVQLSQDADSANLLGFDFNAKTPLIDAASYVLHKAKPKVPPKT